MRRWATWLDRLFKVAVIVLAVVAVGAVVGGVSLPLDGGDGLLTSPHTAQPAVETVESMRLTRDTLTVTLNREAPFTTAVIVGPNGGRYAFRATRLYKAQQSENRPGGWPAGNYTVIDADGRAEGLRDFYDRDVVYLEPAAD